MRRTEKTQKTSLTFAVVVFISCGLSGTSSASELYADWRVRTGLTSVALFYTEQGLKETCHGFWARNYLETDPNSGCFRVTTNSGSSAGNEPLPIAELTLNEPEVIEVEDPNLAEPDIPSIKVEPQRKHQVKPELATPEPNPKDEPMLQTTKTSIVISTPMEEVPGVISEQPLIAEPTANSSPITSWTVQSGNHLWGISGDKRVYNDPYQWPLLYKTNRHQIKDADLLQPGQVILIDRNHSEAEIRRAIDHARTRGPWTLGLVEVSDIEYLSRELSDQ
jgi:nucleoid-associated protein YgaU